MPHRFIAGDTGQCQASESFGDLHPAGSLIDAPRFVQIRLPTVVITVAGKIVGNPHQHAPQTAVRLANDGAVIAIGLVALVA